MSKNAVTVHNWFASVKHPLKLQCRDKVETTDAVSDDAENEQIQQIEVIENGPFLCHVKVHIKAQGTSSKQGQIIY